MLPVSQMRGTYLRGNELNVTSLSTYYRISSLQVKMNFLELDEDTLLQIFEELRPHQNLRSLSLTCKRVRQMCMSTLFRECSIEGRILVLDEAEYVQKFPVWGFVRYVIVTFLSSKAGVKS